MAEQPRRITHKPKPGTAAQAPQATPHTAGSDAPAQHADAGVVPVEPDGPVVLRTKGLTKDYGDIVALSPTHLAVGEGEAIALIGHNGSGKTTLLRMCAGLLDASAGTVTVAGHTAGTTGARAALSYLSDTPTFYDDLSVWDHLELTARLHGVDEWQQHAADLLGAFGIYERADDLPSRFSRGLKQKAAIAIAAIRPMEVLLVDEPFVGLDAAGKAALLDLFDVLHADGTALVVATHELSFVSRVSRCVALRDGAVVHDGAIDGIDPIALATGDH